LSRPAGRSGRPRPRSDLGRPSRRKCSNESLSSTPVPLRGVPRCHLDRAELLASPEAGPVPLHPAGLPARGPETQPAVAAARAGDADRLGLTQPGLPAPEVQPSEEPPALLGQGADVPGGGLAVAQVGEAVRQPVGQVGLTGPPDRRKQTERAIAAFPSAIADRASRKKDPRCPVLGHRPRQHAGHVAGRRRRDLAAQDEPCGLDVGVCPAPLVADPTHVGQRAPLQHVKRLPGGDAEEAGRLARGVVLPAHQRDHQRQTPIGPATAYG
jgi:hypothetical protein